MSDDDRRRVGNTHRFEPNKLPNGKVRHKKNRMIMKVKKEQPIAS